MGLRKVFLDDLPKWESGKNKGQINWQSCIGRKVNFIYDDIMGSLIIKNYVKESKFINIIYNGNEYSINYCSFTRCCFGDILNVFTRKYKYEVGEVVDDIKILEQIRTSNGNNKTQKGYRYQCLICKNIDIIDENDINKGTRCNVCGKSTKKVLQGYNDIATTSPWMINLLEDKTIAYLYRDKSNYKTWFKCPVCGNKRFLQINKVFNYGMSCKRCSDGISYPNKFMFNLLEQLNLDFISEYSPEWIKPKRYDFYIPSLNLIIEMDGAQHSKDKSKSSNWINLEEQTKIDEYKDLKAKEHNITVERIDCNKSEFNLIKENIITKLDKLLCLNNVIWEDCHRYAILNTRVFEICELWNNNKSVKEIATIMNIDRSRVVKYLKQGNIINLCDYNPELEKIKSYKVNGKFLKNISELQVVCLNTNEVYSSIAEASKITNSPRSHISSCCNGKRFSCGEHKGERLVWRHYDEYKKMNKSEIDNLIKKANITPNGTPNPVFCVNNNCMYSSSKSAYEKTGISAQGISNCCKGKQKSAGKHPETGEPLRWMYYDEYIKQQNKNIINT